MFHMSFTYVLHARPLRICIRTPSSAPIDGSPRGFWDSARPCFCFRCLNGRWRCRQLALSKRQEVGISWYICSILEEMLLNVINNELLWMYPLLISLFIIYLTFINLLTMWSTHGLFPILWGWSCQKGLIAIRNPHCWDDHGRPLIAGALFLTFVAVPMWFAVKACLGHIYIYVYIYIFVYMYIHIYIYVINYYELWLW